MRKALLVGISGRLGSALLDALLADIKYKGVTVLTRYEGKRLKNIHLKVVRVNFSNIEAYLDSFEGVDDVFCLLGSDFINTNNISDTELFDYEYPLSIARVAKQAGVQNFILLNSHKAESENNHPKWSKRAALELEVKKLQFENLYIFRVNQIIKSIANKNKFLSVRNLFWKFIQAVSFGKFTNVMPTPANVLAQKMIATITLSTEDKREFSPKDY